MVALNAFFTFSIQRLYFKTLFFSKLLLFISERIFLFHANFATFISDRPIWKMVQLKKANLQAEAQTMDSVKRRTSVEKPREF